MERPGQVLHDYLPQVRTVYKSHGVAVEAVEVDYWWRRPETMELQNGDTGETWRPVDFFRLALHVPWNGGYAQVPPPPPPPPVSPPAPPPPPRWMLGPPPAGS